MAVALAALLVVTTLGLVYLRRRHPAEVATLVIVALPLLVSVPHNAHHWYLSLRAAYRQDDEAASLAAPPVVRLGRNVALAQAARASIAPDEAYAVVTRLRGPAGTAAARHEHARLTYATSWLQYWLAPRLQVDRDEAKWVIFLNGPGSHPPTAARIRRFGNDALVRR